MLSLDGVQNQLSLENILRLRLRSINNNIANVFINVCSLSLFDAMRNDVVMMKRRKMISSIQTQYLFFPSCSFSRAQSVFS